ncbi:PxKF domain-containing protein [Cohnella zeiphila]|uniref:PxKF domain-containing protein n=1 Tax=Cohnella zeiphila TaxID=2761120 RepID=UPI003B586164
MKYAATESVFKQGSTVPVKFRLLDKTGAAITDAKATIMIAEVVNDKVGEEQEAVSTSGAVSGNEFRYDKTEGLYIFNLSTKSLHEGMYQIKIQYASDSTLNAANTEYVNLRLR